MLVLTILAALEGIHSIGYLVSMRKGFFQGEQRFDDLYYLTIVELIVSLIIIKIKRLSLGMPDNKEIQLYVTYLVKINNKY